MCIEEKILVESAVESAKILVQKSYDDLLHPAAKQVGEILEDVCKAFRLLLFPVQFLSCMQDKFDTFLRSALNKVEENNRIMPPAQIIIKVCQDFPMYNGTMSINLWSNLLARFLDKNRIMEAHPAFLVIIPQLCDDEIKILSTLKSAPKDNPMQLVGV